MLDLRLDRVTHDLLLVQSDLGLVSGAEQTAQQIKQRLLTLLGEWFLDNSIGLPWFDEILGKFQTLDIVEELLRSCILQTPNVERLSYFELSVPDPASRSARVDFTAVLITGEEVATQVNI